MPNLFVRGLAFSVSEQHLWEWFSAYGDVLGTEVARDKSNGHSRRYGFVSMADGNSAQAAIEGLGGCEFDGSVLTVSMAANQRRLREPGPEAQYRDLYVKQLPYSTTSDDLKDLFGQVTRVLDARIILNKRQMPKGIAFVTVASAAEAERVV